MNNDNFKEKLLDIKDIDFSTPEGKEVYWHSSAHILAYAVYRLYPNVQITIGPSIENGFYYDFDNIQIGDEDLSKIDEEIHKVCKEKLPFNTIVMKREDAIELFGKLKQTYKQELIRSIPENEEVRLYWIGKGNYDDKDSFVDLCRGPHLKSTDMIKAVKLIKLAGAYWRGDAKNKMLTRVYGISFPSRDELKEYLAKIEEAKRRDHRVIGQKLDLYSFSDYAPGFPFFHDKGLIIIDELVDFWKELHRAHNYQVIKTPQIMKRELWEKSGHWQKYSENMYTTEIENEQYAIKPMNCPGGMMVYGLRPHSYKEFPLRVGELGIVHRHELSGTLSGLFRVRVFTQDDAHIFISEDQLTEEIKDIFSLVDEMYGKFGLSYRVVLSTKPEKYIGTDEIWENSINSLKHALKQLGLEYTIDEGAGAFYGPKIDILLKDALGREHQCGTVQMDMNLPERFDLNYVGSDNVEHRPIMLHRVIYGSLERFFGIITEHFAGKFPLWLNPEQVVIVPVADVFNDYAKEVELQFKNAGFRANADLREISMNKKIRDHEVQYASYILIVGEKEKESKSANVRIRDTKEQKDILLSELIQKVSLEKEKRLITSIFSS